MSVRKVDDTERVDADLDKELMSMGSTNAPASRACLDRKRRASGDIWSPEARLREKKWRIAVFSVCLLGMIIIILIAFILQIIGRI